MANTSVNPRSILGDRLTSPLLVRLPQRLDDALLRTTQRWRTEELAAPPHGSELKSVPGDNGWPFLGHTLDYIRFGTDFMRRLRARHGDVSYMGSFGYKVVVAAGPDATKSVLINRDKAYSQEGWSFLIDSFFHRGLMLMSFDEHMAHRRIMQAAFTRDRLTSYVGQVVPEAEAGVTAWPTGEVRLYPLLKDLTLDVAGEVFMGGRGGGEDTAAVNAAFVATVRAATSLVRAPIPGTRFHAGVKGRELLEDYFRRHLPAARASQTDDLFASLCQATDDNGEQFDDDDIVNHMIFLMMAAHDTTTITTSAVAYYLAKHPEWQAAARAESDAMSAHPDIEELESMDVLDRIIHESLRLVAPTPVVLRQTVKDTELLGHYIPADTIVTAAVGLNHFDEDCWTEPDTFDPDRFSPERAEHKSHRFAWAPFGGGAHKCIGMAFGTLEVKAILHQMLRTYTWDVAPGYTARWDNTSLPVPADGMPVWLRPR